MVCKFEIDSFCAEQLRNMAIPQTLGGKFPRKPQVVDNNHGLDQYGLPGVLFEDLLACVVPESTRALGVHDPVWNAPEHAAFKADLDIIRARVPHPPAVGKDYAPCGVDDAG